MKKTAVVLEAVSVRKVKEGETTNDLYAFLTTEPNAEVGAVHPKAMSVITRTARPIKASGISKSGFLHFSSTTSAT